MSTDSLPAHDPSFSQNVVYENYFPRKNTRSPEAWFDEMMLRVQHMPAWEAIEGVFAEIYELRHAYLWLYDDRGGLLFSESLMREIPADGNFLSTVLRTGRIRSTPCQRDEPEFKSGEDDIAIGASAPVLLCPILRNSGSPVGLVQLSRADEDPFLDRDRAIADYLMRKLCVYAPYIFSERMYEDAAMSLARVSTREHATVKEVKAQLKRFFRAKSVVVMQQATPSMFMLFHENEAPECVSADESGVAGRCLMEGVSINEKMIKNDKAFNPKIDEPGDESALFWFYDDESGKRWVIGLRGRTTMPYYTKSDETQFRALLPFAVKAICAKVSPKTGNEAYESLEERLTALLEVAETLAGVLDIDQLIPTIMKRACALLDADRCSLFLMDKTRQKLISTFHGGLAKSIRIDISKGIVGYTATTGQVVKIDDVYQDPRFDQAVDKATGYRTVSLLSVPIYNNRGEITGVTEMMNKHNGTFTEDDVRMMIAFNVFCGTSLDNAKLYKASLDLTKQLRTFTELSTALNTQASITEALKGILHNARAIVSASRATLFAYDNNENSLSMLVSVGDKLQYGTLFAEDTIAAREPKLYSYQDVQRMTSSQSLESAIERIIANTDEADDVPAGGTKIIKSDSKNKSSARASTVLTSDSQLSTASVLDQDGSKSTICCIPLMNSEQVILGVMELSCKWKIVTEDMKLLECFAVFASVSLDRKQLKEIAEIGQTEVEVNRWLMPNEKEESDKIPMKFMLQSEQVKRLWTINFDAPAYDGVGHIKVLFNIWYKFALPAEFKIPNHKLLRFICEVRDTYKKVPYHNWRHAVDVTQFVTYEILTSKLEQTLTKFELLGMMVSTICHDANHDGFTNVYNVKAETPLGILYKNQSVMETHHCTVSIAIISKDECNLFESLSADDYKKMWTLVISLILATDMARHFDLLKQFNALYDSEQFTLDDPEHRLLLMQLVLKCGDISNVSRPFELADKWCDVLCEEFFRQGDLEMANGMEYTSPLNDRSHLDKPKSQIGFYTFVCLPLFQATAKAIPALECNVNQVQSNLAVWKAAQQANEERH